MEGESGAANKILAGVKKISLADDIKTVFEDCKKAKIINTYTLTYNINVIKYCK